jgi:beta-N-acetylhexosaminidase
MVCFAVEARKRERRSVWPTRPGSDAVKAAVVGIAGTDLEPSELVQFRAHPPAGVILFRRNVDNPRQLTLLLASLRRVLPTQAVLMVDQEGGRVARLVSPHWRRHPTAAAIGRVFDSDPAAGLRAAWLTGSLIGLDAAAAGFDVVTAPVLDLAASGASAVIGDRAYHADPGAVARLGRATAAGLLAAGIQPVMKHLPGHGRAEVDSHTALPCVLANDLRTDCRPFALNADLPWAMTAHILYPLWDPTLPATLSPAVITRIIRRYIGFKGVLVTDDLAMRALSGSPADLGRRALAAGCDLALYCAGDPPATSELLAVCPEVGPATSARLAAASAMAVRRRVPLEPDSLAAERDRLIA